MMPFFAYLALLDDINVCFKTLQGTPSGMRDIINLREELSKNVRRRNKLRLWNNFRRSFQMFQLKIILLTSNMV